MASTALPRMRQLHGTPSTPTLNRKGSLLPTPGSKRDSLSGAAKSLPKRAVSISAFPNPPSNKRLSSLPSSPLATNRKSYLGVDGDDGTDGQTPGKTLKRGGSKLKRSSVMASEPLSARNSTEFLSLPSPPASRSSSAEGSYTSVTTIDMEGESYTSVTTIDMEGETRGREGPAGSEGSGKDSKGNVVVSVRVRPSSDGVDTGEWGVDERDSSITYRGNGGGTYTYDNVFSPEDDNSQVYARCAKRLVRRVMEGYHGTVFAYGQTGTGKTFSMQGTSSQPGVIPLAVTDIFSFIRETPHREFLLRVSYLEIYNERIYDLLNPAPEGKLLKDQQPQEEIKLREDAKRGVYATPLKEEIVQSPTQLLRVIARGDLARRTGSTQFNSRSSRSHAVVQIVVESRDRIQGVNNTGSSLVGKNSSGVRVSTLSLIDLAGSERAAENKERRQEGAHINKSLLTLGTVIAKLASIREKEKAGDHLPYRDSKLTRLLQPALSGNSLVSILCTVSTGGITGAPASSINETLNTLKFAARARNNIVSHAKKADESMALDAGGRALLERYRAEIETLRRELEQQKALEEERASEEAREKERERHDEQLIEMQLARTALKERIEHLNRLILCSKSSGVNHRASIQSARFNRESSVYCPSTSRPYSTSSAGTSILDGIDPNTPSTASSIGEAPLVHQINALQADLADKNAYIATLERRLVHARRNSQSRVSMNLHSPSRYGGGADGQMEELLREKDKEIWELRERLEDKERMVKALRETVRSREYAETLASPTSDTGRRSLWQELSPPQPLRPRKAKSTPNSPDRPLALRSVSPHPADPNLLSPTSPSSPRRSRSNKRISILDGIDTLPLSRKERREGFRAISGQFISAPPEVPLPPTPPRVMRRASSRKGNGGEESKRESVASCAEEAGAGVPGAGVPGAGASLVHGVDEGMPAVSEEEEKENLGLGLGLGVEVRVEEVMTSEQVMAAAEMLR